MVVWELKDVSGGAVGRIFEAEGRLTEMLQL
jgi:hypothetical protein